MSPLFAPGPSLDLHKSPKIDPRGSKMHPQSSPREPRALPKHPPETPRTLPRASPQATRVSPRPLDLRFELQGTILEHWGIAMGASPHALPSRRVPRPSVREGPQCGIEYLQGPPLRQQCQERTKLALAARSTRERSRATPMRNRVFAAPPPAEATPGAYKIGSRGAFHARPARDPDAASSSRSRVLLLHFPEERRCRGDSPLIGGWGVDPHTPQE